MTARSTISLALACLAASLAFAAPGIRATAAAPASGITLPSDHDAYSALVARAASGDQSVDFHALRFAYLKSAAHKRGGALDAGDGELQKQMFAAMQANDSARVRVIAERLISADYINIYGHKGLRQACEHLNDAACAAREHFIEFGLLKSITNTGDGKTCKTGWEVVTVAEEYFIVAMIGARVQSQALLQGAPSCDALTVTGEDGKTAVYFFRIDAVLADEAAMLGH